MNKIFCGGFYVDDESMEQVVQDGKKILKAKTNVTPESIQEAVDNYLEEHPVSGEDLVAREGVSQLSEEIVEIQKSVIDGESVIDVANFTIFGGTPVDSSSRLVCSSTERFSSEVASQQKIYFDNSKYSVRLYGFKNGVTYQNPTQWTDISPLDLSTLEIIWSNFSEFGINIKRTDGTYYTDDILSDMSETTYRKAEKKTEINRNTERIEKIERDIDGVKEYIDILLPNTVFCTVGHETNIYLDNILICKNPSHFDFKWVMNGITNYCRAYNECLRITPTTVTQDTCSLIVYNKITHEEIMRKSFVVKCVADSEINGKMCIIGDSLTDKGLYPAEIQHNLSHDKLIGIGTKTDTVHIGSDTVTVLNEGRQGWTAGDYCSSKSGNAFWDGTEFNFGWYMSQNGFDLPKFVVITLGTNDVADANASVNFDAIINNFKTIVNSIKAYNSTIKIIVSLTTPSATQDGWGNTNGRTGSEGNFDWYQKQLVKRLLTEFDGKMSNVYVSPNHMNLDTVHDFPTETVPVSARNPITVSRQTDNVHPNDYGYFKIADIIWNTMQGAMV